MVPLQTLDDLLVVEDIRGRIKVHCRPHPKGGPFSFRQRRQSFLDSPSLIFDYEKVKGRRIELRIWGQRRKRRFEKA